MRQASGRAPGEWNRALIWRKLRAGNPLPLLAGTIAESPQNAVPFGAYLLLKRIAVGGMAELFLAQDTSAGGRLVVIKRILPYLTTEAEFVRMFLDEARIAAQLDHPNIVHTFELGRLDDTLFIAMEYVEGIDLRKVLQEEQRRKSVVPWRLAAFLTAEVAAGLGAAHHSRGVDGRPMEIIHRDISPQNVMLAFDGRVKLVDFGIAKATTLVQNSKPGVIKGKFLYLSPEQLTQERLDSRSDLFPLGAMLYEAITGQSPFYKAPTEAIIYAIRNEEPPPPRLVRASLPAELSRIVMRCLTKDREYRYQDALDVERDLRALLAREAPTASFDLAGYVGALFGEEEDRTVLHMPAAPRGRTHETLPVPTQDAALSKHRPGSTPELGDNPFDTGEATALASPELLLGVSDDRTELAPRGALEALLKEPRGKRSSGSERPAFEDIDEPTASTAAARPQARAAEKRRRSSLEVPAGRTDVRSSETSASPARRASSTGVPAPQRSVSHETVSRTRPTGSHPVTAPSRTGSLGAQRTRSREGTLTATAERSMSQQNGEDFGAPEGERDPTLTGPLDPRVLLEDVTPSPRVSEERLAPSSAGRDGVPHGALGEDEESTMNFPPGREEGRTARLSDEEEPTSADGGEPTGFRRLGLAILILLSVGAVALGAWLLWPEKPSPAPLQAPAVEIVPPMARPPDAAPSVEGKTPGEVAETKPASAAKPAEITVRLLAPRGTRIYGAGGRRLALATPLTFPEGRLTLKVRCPGRRSRRRTQNVELRADEGLVRTLAFCGAKIPK